MQKRSVTIIGSGPAAFTAAIYVARADLKPLLFEGFESGFGGQLMFTTEVENFPGFPKPIMGADLIALLKEQALRFGTEMVSEDVLSIDMTRSPFLISGTRTKVESDAIIVATGARANRLDVPGSKEFWQKGVTACAVCDGASPIFRNRDLYVIGGGDTAVEEATFLTRYAKKVYIVHRRDQLKASKIMANRARSNPKIEIIFETELVRIEGDDVVRAVILKKGEKEEKREASGVFFAIGYSPNTNFLQGQLELDRGYIVVKKGSSFTSREGIFAAGDVQDYVYRQAITAAGSGCMAAIDSVNWLFEKGFIQ